MLPCKALRNNLHPMIVKDTPISYFCVTSKNLHYSLHYISPNTQKILASDTFYWLELVTVIFSFLKIFSLKKDIQIFFNISENLRENQSPKLVFWKDYAFSVQMTILKMVRRPFHATVSFFTPWKYRKT